ncbi:MAG: S8 family serine peptidase [Ignavibacteria bacterium]|jgi:subtilisin family serine protease|nr:S8 family serine peptidase [Ignavibacteria bacterium]
MKHSVILILAFILAAHIAAFPQEIKKIKYHGQDIVKDELIIKFKRYPGISAQSNMPGSRSVILKNKKATVKKIWSTGAEHWKVSTDSIDALIRELRSNPDVEYAEPNYVVHHCSAPNDGSFNLQWAVNGTSIAGISAMDAWAITTGDTSIVIGVIDSGIDYLHVDLKANIWTNKNEIPGNGIDDDHNGYVDDVHGWDFFNNDNNPMDDNHHGTHVAGIIAAKGNNNLGIAGTAWNVKLAAMKFLNNVGDGETSQAIQALEYCIANGIKIVNCSWGGSAGSQALYDEISKANQAGVIVVAASGNSGIDMDITPQYPAAYDLPNIISVAAHDSNGNLASFSNYGKISADLSAPGVDIYSCIPDNQYGYISGTSMAAPFVTGAVALIKTVYPEKTNAEVKDLLLSSVDKSSNMLGKTVSGGRLNLYKPLKNSGIISVKLSESVFDFGWVALNGNMPEKKVTVYNSSTESINIDTIKSAKGFLISSPGGLFSDVLVNTPLGANQSVDIMVKADPKEERSYDTLVTFRFSRGGATLNKQLRCRLTAIPKGTVIISAEVSGTWSKAMSPIIINSTVKVASGQKLDIEPGVEVIFCNNSGISSSQSDAGAEYIIRAIGTKQDSIYFRPMDPKTPWSGFSFTGRGKYIFEHCSFLYASKNSTGQTGSSGGAIYCAGPDLRIVNSRFYGNHAAVEGGAVDFSGSDATLFIDSSGFTGNDAVLGGALVLRGKENWLMNSEFLNNNCTQGIVKIQGASSATDSNEKAFVYKCSFKHNASKSWGSMIDASSINKVVIKNCLGAMNSIGGTQGIINLNTISTAIVSNCTLYDNYNSTGGNGAALMVMQVKDGVLENSILWDKYNNEIKTVQDVNQRFTASHNSIKNYSEIAGNSNTAPDFSDTLSYRLAANSVLRDKGNPLEIFNDQDGSRNDLGYEGGNPLVFYPVAIDFGRNGLVNSTAKTVSAGYVNFNKDAVPVQSWSVSSGAFTVSGMPGQMLPFKANEILISFSPKEVKNYYDTLYINTNLASANKLKILLSGICEDINSKGGEISGELVKGVYHIVNDLHVSKGNMLTVNAGVTLLFQPNTRLIVEGDLEVKGTPEEQVVFSPESDTSYTGIITIRGNNTKDILLENLVLRKMTGFNIESVARKIVFTKCEFTDNNSSGLFLFSQGSTAEFNGCRFTGNSTAGALVYSVSGKLYINNCVISRNTSSAYILADKNKTYIYNSSLFNNKSESGIMIATDPAAAAFTDSCKVINSIIADNINASAKYQYEVSLVSRTAAEPLENPSVKVFLELTNTCIKGGAAKLFVPSGSKNISFYFDGADPQFADSYGNLSGSSPCINKGTNTYDGLKFSAVDLSGNFRIWNGRIDLGAYEYGSKKYSAVPAKGVLDYPKDQDTVIKNVTLKWRRAGEALTYYLQVSDTIAFTRTVYNDSALTDTAKAMTLLSYSKKYFWRVAVHNGQNLGPWSDVWSFNTITLSPGSAPVLKQPADKAVNQPLALTLLWRKFKGADKYQLQVSKELNFSSLVVNDSAFADTLKQIPGLTNSTEYHWRVRALNQGGAGPWSEEWTFTTKPPLPAIPVLAKPLNDSKDSLATLKLEWKVNKFTDKYRLIVSEDEQFSKIKFADSTHQDTVRVVKELKEGMKYFWKVSSINAAGETYSDTWAFTTLLNAPDSLKAKVLSRNKIELKWLDKSNGESGFIIERRQSADFMVLDTVDANITSYTDSTINVKSFYKYRVSSFTPFMLSVFTGPDSVTTGVEEYSHIPKDYMLLQNYPNPFNPVTVIKYGLPSESHVKLTIYNALGQEAGKYVNEIQSAGFHQINFNASGLSSGVYYYLLDARATDGSRDFRKVKKMMVIK